MTRWSQSSYLIWLPLMISTFQIICAVRPSITTCMRYNETEAKILVKIAAAAYSDKPELCTNGALPRNEQWQIIDFEKVICDFARSICATVTLRSDISKKIIVAFRGTNDKMQLFIESWQSLMPNEPFFNIGMVNRYFSHGLNVIWPKIEQMLNNSEYKTYDVIFTGHSLGGAFASLASVQTVLLNLRTSDQIKLVTFGEPRVGDHAHATYHDHVVPHSFRLVHRMDIIPHLPTCSKNDGMATEKTYHSRRSKACFSASSGTPYHHGTEIWYPDGMHNGARYLECAGEPLDEDFECSDSLIFKLHKFKNYINDHRHYFGVRVKDFGIAGCLNAPNFRGPTSRKALKNYGKANINSSIELEHLE